MRVYRCFERVFTLLDEKTQVEFFVKDGEKVTKGTDPCGVMTGDIRVLLSGERTALNYLQRLSGIATYTHQRGEASEKDLRRSFWIPAKQRRVCVFLKNMRCAGRRRHAITDIICRTACCLKDNHIDAAGGVKEAVAAAKAYAPFVRKIEVETENLDMVKEAVEAGADIIMLDNMTPERDGGSNPRDRRTCRDRVFRQYHKGKY